MWINQDTMDKIHNVQLEMWDTLSKLLDSMGITYFFVHGSLLGAVTRNDFIPEDDDIDIAIFREDYDRLIHDGNKYLPSHYFIQSSMNDDFPLAFAKFKDSRTAFIQPVLNKYNCNKGIYIDIFPIDYCINDKFKAFNFKIRRLLLMARINSRIKSKKSIKLKILTCIALALYPSYKKAVNKREKLSSSLKKSNFVRLTNGKPKEQKMPYEWFSKAVELEFCGQKVSCPIKYNEYLSAIYGKEFLLYNPAEKRIGKEKKIEISASVLDFNNSYIKYVK